MKFTIEQLYKLQKKYTKKILKYNKNKYYLNLEKINKQINKQTGPKIPVLPDIENINKVIKLNINIKKQKNKEKIEEIETPKIPKFNIEDVKEEEEEDSDDEDDEDSDDEDDEDDFYIETDSFYDRLKIELIKDWIMKNRNQHNLEYNKDFIIFLMSFFVMDNVKEKNVLEMINVSNIKDLKRLYNIHLNKRY